MHSRPPADGQLVFSCLMTTQVRNNPSFMYFLQGCCCLERRALGKVLQETSLLLKGNLKKATGVFVSVHINCMYWTLVNHHSRVFHNQEDIKLKRQGACIHRLWSGLVGTVAYTSWITSRVCKPRVVLDLLYLVLLYLPQINVESNQRQSRPSRGPETGRTSQSKCCETQLWSLSPSSGQIYNNFRNFISFIKENVWC